MTQARRYVVTGAASGIGKAVAEIVAAQGGALSLVDISQDALEEVASSLRAHGAKVTTIVADLALAEQPKKVIEQSVAFLGGIDALISNAGVAKYFDLIDLPIEAFDSVIALNLRATWLLGQAAHPYLSASRGNIVATGSICGHHPAPPQGAYSVAKAGLLMLIRQMALEWGPDGIRCNSVSPGPTITGATAGVFNDISDPKQLAIRQKREAILPLRKVGTAEEVAHAILFLASEQASQITGQDLLVDGGISTVLLPAAGIGAGRKSS